MERFLVRSDHILNIQGKTTIQNGYWIEQKNSTADLGICWTYQ